jgi:hypothetical protein
MAIAKKEMLIELIDSLDSSEKRFFTRFTNQTGSGETDKFYRLFRHLATGGSLDDPKLTETLGLTGPTQLVNLQRHLYGRILDALRLQHRRRDPGIRVREQIDYANLLYDRGLYLHTLKILGRAKELAFQHHLDLHHLLIIDFEKIIESRHITRSSSDRMERLTGESRRRQEVMGSTVRLSNLQLILQRHFILHGHVSTAREARRFYQQYHHYFDGWPGRGATYQEKVLLERCRFWYHYNQLQLERAAHHSKRWTELIEARKGFRELDTTYYIKGMDRRLLLAFFRGEPDEHRIVHRALENFVVSSPKTRQHRNSRLMAELTLLRARLNQLLLDQDRTRAPRPDELRRLNDDVEGIEGVDRHKQLVLHYKVAALALLRDSPQLALDFLQPVVNERHALRYDLIVYARLLQLWSHYRLGHTDFVGYGTNNLARYLGRIGYRSSYPSVLLALLRGKLRGDDRTATASYRETVAGMRQTVFHLREFRYFDPERLPW